MRFVTITIFTVAGRLVQALAITKPVPNLNAGGMAIPLALHSSFLDSNETMDLDAISSHGISVREKILSALDNYEVNTGKVHPLAVKRNESGLGTRGAGAPLTTYQNDNWMAEISIGTPPRTLKVRIDTGAADMWVLQTGCSGIADDRVLWNPQSSESSEHQAQLFQLNYADGTIVSGSQYVDTVTIAGFTANQIFGSAAVYISPLQNYAIADGLLGLAYPSVSKINAYPLLASLVKQGKLINPTFSLKLSSPGAEMYVGGANSVLYKGNIAYTPVINPGLWQVSMDDVRVNGNRIFVNVPAIIDTGSTYIFGDSERVSELYKVIGGTLKPRPRHSRSFSDFYYLPCDSFPTLSFTFGGTSFEIPPEVLRLKPIVIDSPNCFCAIVGQHTRADYWHIGITFLQGVYSVFDYTTEQVGFAKLT